MVIQLAQVIQSSSQLFSKGAYMPTKQLWKSIALALSSATTLLGARPCRFRCNRCLGMEPLESRLALSAIGLVDTPYTPDGGLDGKIVYIHGGHGYTADGSGWSFQRPEIISGVGDSEMIEDLGNQDQMSLLADYLFRSGATVVPLRPVGNQTNEVVLDNDDTRVTFAGNWSNSTAGVYFGSPGDVPYRFANSMQWKPRLHATSPIYQRQATTLFTLGPPMAAIGRPTNSTVSIMLEAKQK